MQYGKDYENRENFIEEFRDIINTAINFDAEQATGELLKTIKSETLVQKFVEDTINLISDLSIELAEREMQRPENQLQLEWEFDEKYNGKYVICLYITYRDFDNVKWSFDTLEDAMTFMDENDLWDDYYIYHIKDGYAYGWEV